MKRPLALIILDGWGISPKQEGNAVRLAHTPVYDEISRKYPNTTIAAAGLRVGLTPDAPGSSEVGHLNLGAGRIVQTEVAKIAKAIKDGTFGNNPVLKKAFAKAKNSALHLIGLFSDGGVQSSPDTLFALLRMAKNEGVERVFLHPVLDGRDVPPRTADVFIEALEIKMADIGIGEVATLCGRYYAMNKQQNWERTARAYTMLVHGEGERADDAITAIRNSMLRGIADEFIAPIVLEKFPGVPVATIKTGDVVVFFNHRPDQMRQLVKSLAASENTDFAALGKPQIEAVCLVEYDRSFDLPVAFKADEEPNVLAQVFADQGILNSRITETEKYPHLTYFFNGGVDREYHCEQRVLVASPNVRDAESHPEMANFKVTDKFLHSLEASENDVFIVNLAAADLVAQTGNLEKTIEAVQFTDICLGGIVEKIQAVGGIAVITSSHGNCEEMADLLTGEPNNAPTANQVPFYLIDDQTNDLKLREDGALEDVAPTILGILGIEKPLAMTGNDLREI